MQEGYIGALSAYKRLDESRLRGARPEDVWTFLYPRVRGQMRDAMRRWDWLSRRDRKKVKAGSRPAVMVPLSTWSRDSAFEDYHGTKTFTYEIADKREDEAATAVDGPWSYETEIRLRQLTTTERRVIEMYYRDDKHMWQIADALELSESRISQIHTAAMAKLRNEATEG